MTSQNHLGFNTYEAFDASKNIDPRNSLNDGRRHIPASHQCNEGDFVAAISDYESRCGDEISCRKGDRILVIGPEVHGLIPVRNLTSDKMGYIPSRCVTYVESMMSYEWYFGDITRKEANFLLAPMPEGTFLLRDSSRPGKFAISIKDDMSILIRKSNVRHFLINSDKMIYIWPSRKFYTIRDLIEHCKVDKSILTRLLTSPCPKREVYWEMVLGKTQNKHKLRRSQSTTSSETNQHLDLPLPDCLKRILRTGFTSLKEITRRPWKRLSQESINEGHRSELPRNTASSLYQYHNEKQDNVKNHRTAFKGTAIDELIFRRSVEGYRPVCSEYSKPVSQFRFSSIETSGEMKAI